MLYNYLSLWHNGVAYRRTSLYVQQFVHQTRTQTISAHVPLYSPLLKNTRSGTFPFVFCTMSSYSSGSYDLIVDDLMELQREEHGLGMESQQDI